MRLCVLLRSAKLTTIGNNSLTIRTFFSPCHCQHTHTYARRVVRLLVLQAHRETEAHFTVTGMPSQRNQSDSFRFKRAAFYQSLKSKVGFAAAKAAALRINLNVEGCCIVAAPVHAPSRAPLLHLLLSHNLPLPRVHWCLMGRLVLTGLGSSSLVAHPPPCLCHLLCYFPLTLAGVAGFPS